ncbi:MAG: hypothetical protein P4N59_13165 [Negativicutes bacterium]|nr:hypothetical protein [Negativicutes bacterium]
MIDVMIPLLMKQLKINPDELKAKLDAFLAHHKELCDKIETINATQQELRGMLARVESVLYELVPRPDGSTYEELNPDNYAPKQLDYVITD